MGKRKSRTTLRSSANNTCPNVCFFPFVVWMRRIPLRFPITPTLTLTNVTQCYPSLPGFTPDYPRLPKLPLILIKTEYWDRAGGGGNISYGW